MHHGRRHAITAIRLFLISRTASCREGLGVLGGRSQIRCPSSDGGRGRVGDYAIGSGGWWAGGRCASWAHPTRQLPVQRWWARASWGLRDKVRGMVGRQSLRELGPPYALPVQRWWARASWGLRDRVRGMVGRRVAAELGPPYADCCPSSDGGQGRVGDYAIRSGGWWAGGLLRAGPTLRDCPSSDGGRGRVGDYAIRSGGWWAGSRSQAWAHPTVLPVQRWWARASWGLRDRVRGMVGRHWLRKLGPPYASNTLPVQRWWARASWGLRDKVRGMVGPHHG